MTKPLSERILKIKASPTLSLNAKAAEMTRAGKPVISLAVGEPDFQTPQIIVEKAIESLSKGRTKYGAAGGGPELRGAIAEKLQRENQLSFAADQIVVGMGAKEVLFHLMLSLLNEGDEVLIPAPYWVSYADQVMGAGGVPVVVPVPENFSECPIQVELIQKYATSRTVAILLNSPNNPSGYILSEDQLKELGAFLSKTSWWIISDEIYEYLSFKRPHISFLNLFPELRDRFILVNGFSKGFAMTGWRVGYAAGPRSVIKLVQGLQSHSSTCLPGFIEDAAIVAIRSGVTLVRDQIELLDRRRNLAIQELRKIPNLKFSEPQGAFYVFIDLREALRKKGVKSPVMSSFDFAEFLLNEFFVAAVPGEAFGAPGFIRLSYALSDSKLVEGIQRIRAAIEKCLKK